MNVISTDQFAESLTRYSFVPVRRCNMCGAEPARFRVLGTRLNRSQGHDTLRARGAAVTIVRCGECGLTFPDPQPVPQSLLDHYAMPGAAYWRDSRANPVADPVAVQRWRGLRARLRGVSEPHAIDVGMGSGFTAQAMIAAGFDLRGFEPVPQFREIALARLGLPAGRIDAWGIEDADYPAGSADLVNFGAVLEHLYDPSAALAKALHWLRPGGLIVLEVPSADWLVGAAINFYFRLSGSGFVTNCSPMHSPFHLYEFTAESFRRDGARLGYSVDTIDRVVGGNPGLPGAVFALLRPIMRLSRTGLTLEVVLRRN